MVYNILCVRKPDDPADPHYPSLVDHLMPQMGPADGASVKMHSLEGLTVSRVVDSGAKRVIGARGVSGEMWITDARVVVRCKNYDKVRWTGENTIDQMIWGAGIATTDFLVSKAYHRLRSIGKAMVGHVYLPWISAVAYQPFIRGSQPAAIRLVAKSKLTNGETKTLLLTLDLHKSEDPKAIAEHLYQRTCNWWLRKPAGVTDDMLPRIQQSAAATFVVPEPGKMSSLQLPFFRFTTNTAGLMGEKVEASAKSKVTLDATTPGKETSGNDYVTQQLLQRAHAYQPPFDLLAFDPDGGVATSPLGFAVDQEGGLVMESGAATPHWWARGRGFANLALQRDPNFQVFDGPVEVAITSGAMIVVAREGQTRVGAVGPSAGRVLGMLWPLEEIGGLGVSKPLGPDGHRQLSIVTRKKSWGNLRLTEVNATRKSNDAAWEEFRAGLPTAAADAAKALATGLHIAMPERKDGEEGAIVYSWPEPTAADQL